MDGGTSRPLAPRYSLFGVLTATLLVLAACTAVDPDSVETSVPGPVRATTTTVSQPVVASTTTTAPIPPPPPSSMATTTTTVTSDAEPVAGASEEPQIEDLTTDELDDLLSDLDQILGDLDSSLAQEEGETLND
jgi:hypothetical protein